MLASCSARRTAISRSCSSLAYSSSREIFQALLLGFEVFGFDCQVGVLFDFVTFFAAAFDGFGQFGQTFRVKGVLRVKELKAGFGRGRSGKRFSSSRPFLNKSSLTTCCTF